MGFREDYSNRIVGSVIREANSNIIINSIKESDREANYNRTVNSVIRKDGARGKFISRRPGSSNIRRKIGIIYLGINSVYNREAGRIGREFINKIFRKGNVEGNLGIVRAGTVNITLIVG